MHCLLFVLLWGSTLSQMLRAQPVDTTLTRIVATCEDSAKVRLLQDTSARPLAEEGVSADSITIVDSKSLTIVRIENRNVLTITDDDALSQESSRQELAEVKARAVRKFLLDYTGDAHSHPLQ